MRAGRHSGAAPGPSRAPTARGGPEPIEEPMRTESWTDLGRAAKEMRARIERRIAAEISVMKQHCFNQPESSLRNDITKGSTDLLAIAEWQASRVRN